MVVANALTTDVRVQKAARSAAVEFDVLVVGVSRNSYIESFKLNGIDAITIPWDCWKRDKSKWYKPVSEMPIKSPDKPSSQLAIKTRKILKRLVTNRYSRRIKRYFGPKFRPAKNMSKLEMHIPPTGPAKGTWRHTLMDTMNLNVVFFPTLDKFNADIIHVHDVHLLGLVNDYVSQRHAENVKVVYDAHEYIKGLAIHDALIQDAFVKMESEYISNASAVLTVSDAIAEKLASDHELKAIPKVILNAPNRVQISEEPKVKGIRELINLGPGVPLAVYSGGVHPIRGIDSLVYAIADIENLHLALTINREGSYTEKLSKLAQSLGVSNRLHFVPFVDPNQVVQYLASADVGLSPLPASVVNFDLALPNKIFDYFQCEIPVVTSNCIEVSRLIEDLGVGESYEWDSLNGLVQALRKVMNNLEKYKEPYSLHPSWFSEFTWEVQEVKLLDVYKRISS